MAETSHLNKTVKDRIDVTNQEQTKDSLLPNSSINSGNIAVKTEQTCEPEVVSYEENIREQTNLDPQQLSLQERACLWKDKLAQHLNAGRTTPEKGLNVGKCGQAIKYIIPKQGKNSYRYTKGKSAGLSEDNQPQQSSANSKNSSTVNTSNNTDDTGNITRTEASESEVEPPRSLSGTTNLFNDTKCQNTNIDKEPDVDKSNTVGESGESAQGEVVRIKQEKDTEPSELTFCDTTGLFKNNQNQYFDAEGNLIEPSDLEQEAQKALEKVNSIFTEPILNSEPFQPVNTVNNELVQVPPLAPLTPMGLTANAGILTPVTVTEDNGVISITPVGDAVKNSFITLDNPFMLDDMIDIKEEPLERYDFDTIGTDEDTISAPETMLQDCELGGTDEYVDIPEFVMVNKTGEDEQNLKQMQPAVLEKKLFGDAGVSGLIGVPIIEGNMLPVQEASPVCSSPGQSRKRMYKKVKMVAAYEKVAPEVVQVRKSYSTYPIRKQHPSYYSNEYLASFFAKNGDYTYDHDYIVNMYHNSVAIVLDSGSGSKKLWFCRLCNNQQWTLKHGEHMLDTHALTTRCAVCDVDMRSPFALNLHVERHTEPCRHCAESVSYGARQAHALKHQAEEQQCTVRPRVHQSVKRRRSSRQHADAEDVPEPTRSPDLPSSNPAQDEVVADTSQRQPLDRLIPDDKMENLFYKTDNESEESDDDDVKADTSYSPTPPPRKRQVRKRSRRKSESPRAVEPSGRLLRSHIKKNQDAKEGVS
ncbi:unnamed protein product [Callosobruchus maculatus]|uniref:Uncharacterized protein n=1 Tax=Callosobruchus maculatus TaxID=64391 RepID=A0A653DT81_CALMS|nr:unnamed protein product [Callosobruchus maculatus]